VTEPNALWCADFKGEFLLEDHRYCYPLTITDKCCGPTAPRDFLQRRARVNGF